MLTPRDERLLPEVLPFLCLTERFCFQHAVETSAGSLSPRTNWDSLASFEFGLPPVDEQRRLADILWAIDGDAEAWLNAADASEEHVRSISDETFESNEQKRHLVATDACDAITVGIVVRPASYYTTRQSGVPALRSLNVFPGRFELADLVYLTPEGHTKNSKSTLKKGDVVVVRTGRPGDAAVVTDETAGMNLIDLILVRPKPLLLPEYLVEFLNSAFGRRRVFRGSAGTAQQHFNVSEFERLDIPCPPVEEQRMTVERLGALKAQLQSCYQHADRLTKLQVVLLETLLS